MSSTGWAETMVRLLIDEKRAGELDFCKAWRRASGRAQRLGVVRPRDYVGRKPDDPGWLPYSTFFERACEREYLGLVRTDYINLRELISDDSGPYERVPVRRVGHGKSHTVLLG